MSSDMYDSRVQAHVDALLQKSPNKHTFLTFAKHASVVDMDELANYCQVVSRVNDKADFVLIKIIRLLYLSGDALLEAQSLADRALANFPFWVRKDKEHGQHAAIEKVTFWSENHTFMFLSSAHLFYQRSRNIGVPCLAGEREDALLRAYLAAHVSFEGVYEILSCTYLPYTMSSLLNLLDFSEDLVVKEQARFVLDKIVSQLLLVCNADGICNLAASARQYPALRFRNFSHNVNQLIRLCTGKSTDPLQASALTEFLLTSSYSVSNALVEKHWGFSGFSSQRANHETSATKAIYEATGIDPVDCTTFYW